MGESEKSSSARNALMDRVYESFCAEAFDQVDARPCELATFP